MDKNSKKSSSFPTPRVKEDRKATTKNDNPSELKVQELEERIAPSGLPMLEAE